jgi:hypothetical protein
MPKVRVHSVSLAPVPWWLSEGDEDCPGCGQFYLAEVEFHCPDCDTPTCLHCRKRSPDGRWVCTSCATPDNEGTSNG